MGNIFHRNIYFIRLPFVNILNKQMSPTLSGEMTTAMGRRTVIFMWKEGLGLWEYYWLTFDLEQVCQLDFAEYQGTYCKDQNWVKGARLEASTCSSIGTVLLLFILMTGVPCTILLG